MAKQAKVLTDAELKRVYAICEMGRHTTRNKLILALSYGAGMRACEIAALRMGDVVSADGKIVDAVYLEHYQTKGSQRQTVYLSKRVQKAVSAYLGDTKCSQHIKDSITAIMCTATKNNSRLNTRSCHSAAKRPASKLT